MAAALAAANAEPLDQALLDFMQKDSEESEVVRGKVKGEAGYYRLKPRMLALELTEPLPDGRASVGDFVVIGEDGESGTLYERTAFLQMFERVHFVEDFHEARLPGGSPVERMD